MWVLPQKEGTLPPLGHYPSAGVVVTKEITLYSRDTRSYTSSTLPLTSYYVEALLTKNTPLVPLPIRPNYSARFKMVRHASHAVELPIALSILAVEKRRSTGPDRRGGGTKSAL